MRKHFNFVALLFLICFNYGYSQEFTPDRYTVALYHFNNDGNNNFLFDASGKENHGSVFGATWVYGGKYGKAISFDGVNDYAVLPSPNNLGLANGYTIEAWIKPFAYGPDPGSGGAAFVISGSEKEIFEFHIGQFKPDKSTRYTRFLPKPRLSQWLDGDGIETNVWSHIAVQVDRNGLASLFVNDVFQVSQNIGRIPSGRGNMNIGRRASWPYSKIYWKGLIDELRISNIARYSPDLHQIGETHLPKGYREDIEHLNKLLFNFLEKEGINTVSGKIVTTLVEKAMVKLGTPIPPVLSIITIVVEIAEINTKIDRALTVYLGDFLKIEREYNYPQFRILTQNNASALEKLSKLTDDIDHSVQEALDYDKSHPHWVNLSTLVHLSPFWDIPKSSECIRRMNVILKPIGVDLTRLEMVQLIKAEEWH